MRFLQTLRISGLFDQFYRHSFSCPPIRRHPHRSLSTSFLLKMARESSAPPDDRPAKRIRLGEPGENHLASTREGMENARPRVAQERYRNGVMLAPMVRSGSLPTRLISLKYGADLVWGPEVIDRAIIGTIRTVNVATGVVSYEKNGKPIWTTHPIEKPYLVYQIGTADPKLAVEAAQTVIEDVSGIDLNCGCPKHFSTHGGMGANLLTNPDLLCSILTALREALPSHIPVTAKIRLLPDQQDTLTLVKRIVATGISALTVHCRTKEMRPRERALIERLREVVECVEETGAGIPVIENGDCLNLQDSLMMKDITGAHSVMIARGAEQNPSCFSNPMQTDLLNTLFPEYLSLSHYLQNTWGNTKFCANQFDAPGSKSTLKAFKLALNQAKSYSDLPPEMIEGGHAVFNSVQLCLERRRTGTQVVSLPPAPSIAQSNRGTAHADTNLDPTSEPSTSQRILVC